jgi:hypothetical protein
MGLTVVIPPKFIRGLVSIGKNGELLILGSPGGVQPFQGDNFKGNAGQPSEGEGLTDGTLPAFYALLDFLSVVGESEYPESVRTLAQKLTEAYVRVLAVRYGDGESDDVKIVDFDGKVLFADGKAA